MSFILIGESQLSTIATIFFMLGFVFAYVVMRATRYAVDNGWVAE